MQPIKTGDPDLYMGQLKEKCQALLKDMSYRKNAPGDADEYSNPQFAQLVMEVSTPRTPSPSPPPSPPSPASTLCYDLDIPQERFLSAEQDFIARLGTNLE
mgnify:FL=1